MTTEYNRFLKALDKHPKMLESMERREVLEAFKKEFEVDKKVLMCCPVCTEGFNRGKLYQSTTDPEVFVCKDCLVVLKIVGISISIEDVLTGLKKMRKEEREAKKSQEETEATDE